MAIKVQIPGPLRPLTGGAAEVEVEASDVAGLIEALEARHGGIRERLLDASGELRSYVRVFVDDRDVRALGGKAAVLPPGATVAIVPAIAGGGGDPAGPLGRLTHYPFSTKPLTRTARSRRLARLQ